MFILENSWFLIIIALGIIGISAFLVPVIPSLLYLILPHFGIGFGIGTIDSALMPLLAELVDEQFAAQYGYVYAAAQTAGSAAYAFGPLIGGAMLTRRWLSFESLMHFIGAANLEICLLSFFTKTAFQKRGHTNVVDTKRVTDISANEVELDEKVILQIKQNV